MNESTNLSETLSNGDGSQTLPPPIVSVVLGVYNGADEIQDSLLSLRSQTLREIEIIVVDDGSEDDAPGVLAAIAAEDPRVRVITQENAGLTAALVKGCASARAPLIARMDIGDRSLPLRLERQCEYLHQHPEVVAVDCLVRRIGPHDEHLSVSGDGLSPADVTDAFKKNGTGLVHPAAMFRRDVFERAGGYRREFVVAQDHDLWCRMAEIGLLGRVPELLFEYRVETKGISATQQQKQSQLSHIAREWVAAGEDKQPRRLALLRQAQEVSEQPKITASEISRRHGLAANAYLIGSQLLERRRKACRRYFRMAIRNRPLHLATWAKYIASMQLG
ncbi:MAG: glycosyltransferase [Planctomycetota bacterium]